MMKKKMLSLALAALLAMAMTACGSSSSSSGSTSTTEAAGSTDSAYSYELNGETVAMNAEMAPLVEKLGDPDNYFESESCAFQGMDKVYTYGSVKITTYPKDDVDYVYIVELMDDTVSTKEGVTIGASSDDVTAAYGEATKSTDTSLTYEKGDSILAFMLDGGSVSAITYTAVTE